MKQPTDEDLYFEASQIAKLTGEVAYVIGKSARPLEAVTSRKWKPATGMKIFRCIWPAGWRYRDARQQ